MSILQHSYTGRRFTIVHCEGAIESLHHALRSVRADRRQTFIKWLEVQIERLSNDERLSRDSFPTEGDLPKRGGQSAGKFYALKKKPLRAYCWRSSKDPSIWYISHYIFKDFQKLDSRDTALVAKNWRRIEEEGHDR